MKWILLVVLIALAGCDKADDAAAKQSSTASASTAGSTTGEAIEDLLAKLPEAAPEKVQPPKVQTFGKFGTNGAMPSPDGDQLVEVDSKAVSELNIVAAFRVESAFAERQVDPSESVIVQFGGEEADGLRMTIRYQGKSVSRNIVPANSGPELVSNLDHTTDRLLDELGVPRRR